MTNRISILSICFLATTLLAGKVMGSVSAFPATVASTKEQQQQQQQQRQHLRKRKLSFLGKDNLFEHGEDETTNDTNSITEATSSNNEVSQSPIEVAIEAAKNENENDPVLDVEGFQDSGTRDPTALKIINSNGFDQEPVQTNSFDGDYKHNDHESIANRPDLHGRPQTGSILGTIYSNGLDQQPVSENLSHGSSREDDRDEIPSVMKSSFDPDEEEINNGFYDGENANEHYYDGFEITTESHSPPTKSQGVLENPINNNINSSGSETTPSPTVLEDHNTRYSYADDIFEQGRTKITPVQNYVLLGCLVVLFLLLFGLYWRDTVIETKRSGILRNKQLELEENSTDSDNNNNKNLYVDTGIDDSYRVGDICQNDPKLVQQHPGPLFAEHAKRMNLVMKNGMIKCSLDETNETAEEEDSDIDNSFRLEDIYLKSPQKKRLSSLLRRQMDYMMSLSEKDDEDTDDDSDASVTEGSDLIDASFRLEEYADISLHSPEHIFAMHAKKMTNMTKVGMMKCSLSESENNDDDFDDDDEIGGSFYTEGSADEIGGSFYSSGSDII